MKIVKQFLLGKATLLSIFTFLCFLNFATGQILFEDGFESGVFAPEWDVNPNLEGVNGIVEITANSGVNNSFGVRLGKTSDAGGFTRNSLDLRLDLEGQTEVDFTFWLSDFFEENHDFDGIYFSDNGGQDFVKVFDFLPQSWCNIYGDFPPFDVDDLAVAADLDLTSEFIIRIQQYDNSDFNTSFSDEDGLFIDSVRVFVPEIEYTTLPFADGFESGEFGPMWEVPFADSTSAALSTNPNRVVRVEQGVGLAGSYGVRFGSKCDGAFITNALDLRLNLEGLTEVDFTFWLSDFFEENHDFDGIYFSDNGGQDFVKVFDFLPQSWCNIYGDFPPFDVDELAAAEDLDLTSEFIIRIQQYDNSDFNTSFSDEDGLFIDSVRVFVPEIKYTTLPFADGFESGQFGPMWEVPFADSTSAALSTNPNRIVRVEQGVGLAGSYGVRFGSKCDGAFITNALDLRLNLEGLTEVDFTFWLSDFFEENHDFDGIYFSDNGGQDFVKVFNFLPQSWCNIYGDFPPFDVDQLAAAADLDLTSEFIIRIQQYDNSDFNTSFSDEDGLFIDSVRVFVPEIEYTTLPFADGFESGEFGPMWEVPFADSTSAALSTNPNRIVRVEQGVGLGGSYGVRFGSKCDGAFITNALDLRLNLEGLTEVDFTFWLSDFFEENHDFDGIYFSDNGGQDFVKVFDFLPQSWCNIYGDFPPFDVDELAAAADLDLTSEFIIRIQQYDNSDFNTSFSDEDGLFIDSVRVFVPEIEYTTLPFADGFESGQFGPMWEVPFADSTSAALSTNPNRIVRVEDGVGANSSFGIRMGSRCDGSFLTNAIDLRLNLTGQNEVEMSFWANDFFEENQDPDGVYFSDDGGQNFKKVFDFEFQTVSGYQQYVLDIDELSLDNGLNLTSEFIVRIQQYDNSDFITSFSDEDGLFVDDILVIGDNVTLTWYADTDNDNFGDPNNSTQSVSQPTGFVSNDFDCDDTNANINPAANEICDGIDNDCDDEIDEELTLIDYYPDTDEDGFGDENAAPMSDCGPPVGFVDNNLDCDDMNENINPDAIDFPGDLIDDNCDGIINGIINGTDANCGIGEGLIAYYTFDDTINDQSGNDNNGEIVNNVNFAKDRFGNPNSAYNSEGNGYISIPNSNSLMATESGFTIASWVKVREWFNGWSAVVDFSNGATGSRQYSLYINQSGLIGSSCAAINTTPLQKGIWYHVAVSFDTQTESQTFYIDGINIGSADCSTFNLGVTQNLEIGRDRPGQDELHNGKLDEIRIYQRQLSDAEISEIYSCESDGTFVSDVDCDDVLDNDDNCPLIANPNQEDQDEDDFGTVCDCDDTDENINPAMVEVDNDGLDNDCDGTIDNPIVIPCPTGDLILTSQAEVDAFPANCNIINGHLIINGDDITDLSNLIGLIEVTGCVIIGDTTQNVIGNDILTNLNGLGGITTIGGDLIICQNPELISLSGFSMLMSVDGDILVKNCISLVSLNIINLNFISGSFTLSGLPIFIEIGPWSLTEIGGGVIFYNVGWGSFGFGGFGSITSIGGDFYILNNPNLTQVELINLIQLFGCFHIMNNTLLVEIPDLSNLEMISDDLVICNNDEITNVDNLASLESVGGNLKISGNPNLENLDSLINLISVGDSLIITNNDTLSKCCGLVPILEANGASVVIIEGNPMGCSSEQDILDTCMDNPIVDNDNDGIDDSIDNCLGLANPDQIDGDSDGFGLDCDCDDENPNINDNAIEIIGDNIDNNCNGEIDELNCDDYVYGGEICCDQILCPDDLNPAPITSISLPNNGIGDFEYIWIITYTEPDVGNSSTWNLIPNSINTELDLDEITQTAWIRRCARVVGCEDYLWESNIIMITVLNECEVDCTGFLLELVNNTDVSCFEGNEGSININTVGATGTVSYSWSNSADTEDLVNLSAGTYTLVATDSLECEVQLTVMIIEPEELEIMGTTQNLTCPDEHIGLINTITSGGTEPYTYEWNDMFGANPNISNLSPGSYSLTVTDANNCIKVADFVITSPEALALTPSVSDASCEGDDGIISLDFSGGTPPLSLNWDNGLPNVSLQENLIAGIYSVTLTDANDCQISTQITVSEPDPADCITCDDFEVNVVNITNVNCNDAVDGAIELIVSNGTGNVTYEWTPDLGNVQNPTDLPAGNYQVLVTDANGCTADLVAVITQPDPIEILPTVQDISCFDEDDGSIAIEVSGGTTDYLFDWNMGFSSLQNLQNLPAGNYDLILTDANGCTADLVTVITQPDPIEILPTVQNISCFDEDDGSIAIEVSGGTTDYLFDWNMGFSSQQNLQNLPAGNYDLILTDANGCTADLVTVITQPDPLSATFAIIDATCETADGSIDLEVLGGTTPYVYNWSMGIGNVEDPQNLEAGIYKVTITDANNCFLFGEGIVEEDCDGNNFQFIQTNAILTNNSQSQISFTTRNESPIGYFVLQHSKDGQSFSAASDLMEGYGLNDIDNQYSFIDERPKPGFNYYRIMYFDEQQQFHFSSTEMIILEKNQIAIIHPNPVIDYLTVELLQVREHDIELIILDNFGKRVHREKINTTDTQITIDVNHLPASTYHLWLIEEGKRRRINKFIKLR